MSETILIVGSGAREHAIAAALARSPQRPLLLCFGSARNPGIQALCRDYVVGSVTDITAITAFAAAHSPTLAILGPEAPLAAGVTDALLAINIPVVGPTQQLAQIESSKGFARELLARHKIPGNPWFRRFTSVDGIEPVLAKLSGRHVIKDDGLAGGKGVKVCGDHLHSIADSVTFCRELAANGHPFVIEEKLVGEEFSLLSFCDGVTLRHMPAVQDHKRAYDGDKGPNTGGMGTYTDADHKLPFLADSDLAAAEAINEMVAAALADDCGAPYQGILYGGFMATADGVRLIEYNARFGDPECLNLLSLLETDFVAICRAIVDQTLDALPVTFAAEASVCKYVVPEVILTLRAAAMLCIFPRSFRRASRSISARWTSARASWSPPARAPLRSSQPPRRSRRRRRHVRRLPRRFPVRSSIARTSAPRPLIAQRVQHMKSLRPS